MKSEITAVGIRHADHVAPSICKRWHELRREEAVVLSVYFARGLCPRRLLVLVYLFSKLHFVKMP
jgi:hypothetical protein